MKSFVVLLTALVVFLPSSQALADTPGYVILTTTGIVAQSTQLTNFVAAKEARGFSVQVVQNKSAAQGGWCGTTNGPTGNTAADLLRNWLVTHYTNASGVQVIDYALLIGNPDPTTGDVPMKLCYPSGSSPTDYYYADLTGDWDINTNGYYGEWADFNTNGGPDLTSEVIVGRIPCYGNIADLDAILGHTIQYENNLASQSSWRRKALLPASPVSADLAGNHNGYLFGEHLKTDRLIPGEWNYHRVYDQEHGLSPVPETVPCTPSNVVAAWNTASPGAVFWFQHGSQTAVTDIMDLDNAANISTNNRAFTFQGSCWNAHPETTNNLAYTLLLRGCTATTGATRPSWWVYSVIYVWGFPVLVEDPPPWSYSGSVPYMIDGYAQRFVNNGLAVGDTIAQYREDVVPSADIFWENHCIFNIYGCPAVGIRSVKFSGPLWSF